MISITIVLNLRIIITHPKSRAEIKEIVFSFFKIRPELPVNTCFKSHSSTRPSKGGDSFIFWKRLKNLRNENTREN